MDKLGSVVLTSEEDAQQNNVKCTPPSGQCTPKTVHCPEGGESKVLQNAATCVHICEPLYRKHDTVRTSLPLNSDMSALLVTQILYSYSVTYAAVANFRDCITPRACLQQPDGREKLLFRSINFITDKKGAFLKLCP